MTDVKSETIETAAGGITHSPAGPKAIIKNVDMNEELQQESVDITNAALEKYNVEKDIAAHIKKEFDRRYGATWHVVVGKNFGSYVTHGLSSFFTRVVGRRLIYCMQKPNISSTFTSDRLRSSSGNHR